MTICVIPSAGKGTRLGSEIPKLFLELKDGFKTIDVLISNILSYVDEICFVIRPDMVERFESEYLLPKISYVIQNTPLGMGDAVFSASSQIVKHENLLVVWGDQASISQETINLTKMSHAVSRAYFTVPLVDIENPYVHYEITHGNELNRVLQSREGDQLPKKGRSDVGVFALKTRNLEKHWMSYRIYCNSIGASTGELNFLPFFSYLSQAGELGNFPQVKNRLETRGINTREDLDFFKNFSD
jgi:bifunctional UDP-N-acetylglucosamine pyrophosphorylase/glucosamine-1-phosphate N-acetyltransferase